MRPSLGKSCLAVLRSIAGLTQRELAQLVGVSRPTIQAVELGKLPLSRRLAEKVSLHCGVNRDWLLANKYKVAPTCLDPREPYTKEVFDLTRAQIQDPRTSPGERLVQFKTLGGIYWRLGAMLLQAYRSKKTVYLQHKLRLFLDDLELEFPRATDLPVSDDVRKTAGELWGLLERIQWEARR